MDSELLRVIQILVPLRRGAEGLGKVISRLFVSVARVTADMQWSWKCSLFQVSFVPLSALIAASLATELKIHS